VGIGNCRYRTGIGTVPETINRDAVGYFDMILQKYCDVRKPTIGAKESEPIFVEKVIFRV